MHEDASPTPRDIVSVCVRLFDVAAISGARRRRTTSDIMCTAVAAASAAAAAPRGQQQQHRHPLSSPVLTAYDVARRSTICDRRASIIYPLFSRPGTHHIASHCSAVRKRNAMLYGRCKLLIGAADFQLSAGCKPI